jgi:poly-gamma-glutamate synthesis protein (capsule biosynthesis protein)
VLGSSALQSLWAFCGSVPHAQHCLDRAIVASLGSSYCCADHNIAVEGRRGVYKLRSDRLRSKKRPIANRRRGHFPEALKSLKTFGFNLLSLSNNHSWDFKVPGIENTLEQAKRLELVHAGIGQTVEEAVAPGYMHTPKGTVALVAMASGLIADGGSATAARPSVNELRIEGNVPNLDDSQRILQSIRNAKQRADLVVVYQHNHVFDKPFGTMMRERSPERLVPPDWLVKWTHAEVDAGADTIVMHGAPPLHGVEIYRDRPIFFDLGNFIFQTALANVWEPTAWESVVAYVDFEGTTLKSIKFRPIAMNKIDQSQADTPDTRTNNLLLQTSGLPSCARRPLT